MSLRIPSLVLLSCLLPGGALAGSGGPDVGGYTWIDSNSAGGPAYAYQFGSTLNTSLSDDDYFDLNLPFAFTFYGLSYTTVSVNSNGGLAFGGGDYLSFSNTCGPSTSLDLAAVFWDDLNPADFDSVGIYHGVVGTAPNRIYLVEWWSIDNYADTGNLSAEIKLFENDSAIEFHYWDVDLGSSSYSNGASATVGLAAGSFSQLQVSCNSPSLSSSYAVRFEPPGASCTDNDGDGSCQPADCNDSNASVFPGAAEQCNGVDDDCDFLVDEGWDGDGDGVTSCAGDCNDGNGSVYPGATESCDGVDNNCNGQVDEGFDGDGDGYSSCGGDCNDGNAAINPGAPEACNGIDDNCNGQVDENADVDGDGVTACSGDCDDNNAAVYPGASEVCDGADNDCNGVVDDGFDADGDGWSTCTGDCNDASAAINPGATEACNGFDDNCNGTIDEATDLDGDGVSGCAGDCDENDASVYPGATEACNGIDDDCDGAVDEGFDGDGDGFTSCDGDCNDVVATVYPGAPEVCDGLDNDCDGVNADFDDLDGDGAPVCDDCDDADPDSYPGAEDLPLDGIDQDCDGEDNTEVGDDDDTTSGDDDDTTSGDDDDSGADPFGTQGTEAEDQGEREYASFGCTCATVERGAPSAWWLLGLLGVAGARRRR